MTKAEIEKRAKRLAGLFKKHTLLPDPWAIGVGWGPGPYAACLLSAIGVEKKYAGRGSPRAYLLAKEKVRGSCMLEAGFMGRKASMYGLQYKHGEKTVSYKIGKRVAELVGLE